MLQTIKRYKPIQIFHDCNCFSKNLIYLMQCSICNKQYVGKTQTTQEKRINCHRSDVKCKNEPIAADKHFRLPGHEFDRETKFTIIEQAINKRDKSEMATFLMSIDDTWILRLKTLATPGLNDQLNFSAQSRGYCLYKSRTTSTIIVNQTPLRLISGCVLFKSDVISHCKSYL